jgi:hypothetical protein
VSRQRKWKAFCPVLCGFPHSAKAALTVYDIHVTSTIPVARPLLPPEPITFAPQHRGIPMQTWAFSTIPLPLPFLVDSQGNCSSGEILAQAGQLLMVMQIVLRHNRRHQHRRPHCDHAGSPTNDHRRLYRRLHFAVRQGLQEEASGQHERQAPGAGSTRPSASGSSSRSW